MSAEASTPPKARDPVDHKDRKKKSREYGDQMAGVNKNKQKQNVFSSNHETSGKTSNNDKRNHVFIQATSCVAKGSSVIVFSKALIKFTSSFKVKAFDNRIESNPFANLASDAAILFSDTGCWVWNPVIIPQTQPIIVEAKNNTSFNGVNEDVEVATSLHYVTVTGTK